MKTIPAFKLEEAIMNAWNTKEDIDMLRSNIEGMSLDEKIDVLNGISILMDLKFQNIMNCLNDAMQEETVAKTNISNPFVFDDAFDYEVGLSDFD